MNESRLTNWEGHIYCYLECEPASLQKYRSLGLDGCMIHGAIYSQCVGQGAMVKNEVIGIYKSASTDDDVYEVDLVVLWKKF